MATVDPRQKNKSFLKGYGQIRSHNDDEGMEAFFQKERLFFTRLMRASKDVQGKVSNLASDFTKIESSQDMHKDFETLRNNLKQVTDAFKNNCQTLLEDPLPNGTPETEKHMHISDLLESLVRQASQAYGTIEDILNPIESQNPAKLKDMFQKFINSLPKWENRGDSKTVTEIKSKAIRRYLNETSDDIARMLEKIGEMAAHYTKTEIPKVIDSQNRDKDVLTNVATVSTIITAVTAAIITASVGQENPTNLFKAVNAFWFFSLALSVAAVVSSMLDLFRRSYLSCRSPGNVDKVKIPDTIQTWIQNSPRVFLAMSVIAFQAGLCLLAFASHQPSATSIITTTITLLSSVALVLTISWFSWHHISHSPKPSWFSWRYIWRSPEPPQSEGTKDGVEDLSTLEKQDLDQTNSDPESGSYNTKRSRSCNLLRSIPGFARPWLRILCPSNTTRNRAQHPSGNLNKETHEANNKHNAPSDFAIWAVGSESVQYKKTLNSMLEQDGPPSPSSERFDPQLALNRLRPPTEYKSSHLTDASALAINSNSTSAILQLSFSFDGQFLAALDSEGHCTIYSNLTDPRPEGKKIETGSDGYLLDILWFPASHYLALKFQNGSGGSDPDPISKHPAPKSQSGSEDSGSDSDSNSDSDSDSTVEEHRYAIYDASGKSHGKTPPLITEHVQLLHTKIGLAVFKEPPEDSDIFTFELYYPNSKPNADELRCESLQVQVPKLRCFSITRDDRYMIIGSDLQTPEKEETHVSVIDLHSDMKILFEMPLSQDLRRITTSTYTGRNRLIFEYNNAPPELWIFSPIKTENASGAAKKQKQAPERVKEQEQNILKMVKIYQLPHSTNIDNGRVRFGGRSDEMVIYSRDPGTGHGGSGLLTFWGRTSGSVLSLQRSPNLSEVNYAVCSHTKEGTFFIAYGLKNGEVQIWKSERGTKPGTDPSGRDNNKNTEKSGPES